jgi:uracil-DNA glycosylase
VDLSWKIVLRDEFQKPYFKALAEFVEEERRTTTVYPPVGEVFRAFVLTPYDRVKVVILGQDPYHGPKQAHGLSFSVRPGVVLPPSLRNIYRELSEDVGFRGPGHGYLRDWAVQGVFLLNATLTVREGSPGSHQGKGWETFTDAVIRALDTHPHPLVFILWGQYARSKKSLIDTSRHRVLESAHPSPMSAERGFFGSRPFSRANQSLREFGLAPVNWQLPDSVSLIPGSDRTELQ